MTTEEIKQLQDKINQAKENKAKAQGAIEQIEKTWKEKYDCDNIDQVKEKIETLKKEKEELQEKLTNYEQELKQIMENN